MLSRAKSVFTAAMALKPDERQAHVLRACGDDVALLELVRLLLASAETPLSIEGLAEEIRVEVGANAAAAGPSGSGGATVEHDGSDVRIGNYRLLERIGEGGFGVVFLAEQERPLRRRVAIKIIKLGMDTREVIARFEGERQALALMDHPNIARVFDAGATASGRPYFVMELVKGVPITAYCDEHRLSIRARLELFTQVCDAIQHAHQRGIIHRDIKPSNVLVSEFGDRAVPKVIDFGIAKATSGRLAELTVFTAARNMIGTPEYMSPEQAGESGQDIDTRTDIYSAGALLYELLTGTTPFEPQRLRAASLGEMQRIIRDEDPPKPSSRTAARTANGELLAARRATQPRRLAELLRGELDWIVRKAMEKERGRRYESAAALAADVRRHLAGQPVLAAPPGAGYLFRTFVRRHRGPVLAGALLTLALVGGLVGTSIGLVQAKRQREAAVEEGRRVEAINAFVMKALRSSDPFSAGRGDTTIAEAMRNALTEIRQGAFAGDPQTEAALKSTIGQILENNGQLAEAEGLLRDALTIRQTLFGADGGDHPAIAESMAQVAHVWAAQGRLVDAEPLYEQSLAMLERLHSGDHPALATALKYVANERLELGRPAEAEPLHERCLAMRRRLFPNDHPDVAESTNDLARVRNALGRTEDAEQLYSQALEMYRRIFVGDHPRVAVAMNNLAVTRLNLGRAEEASSLLTEMRDMCARLFPGDHDMKAMGLHNTGRMLMALGRTAEAEASFDESLGMQRRLRAGDHLGLASVLNSLARSRLALGRIEEAERDARESMAMFNRLFPGGHPRTAVAVSTLALALHARGQRDEAQALVEAAEALVLRSEPASGPNAVQVLEARRTIETDRAQPGTDGP